MISRPVSSRSRASTRATEVRIASAPLGTDEQGAAPARALQATLQEALPDRDVRAAIERDPGRGPDRMRDRLAISIRLSGPEPAWLTLRTRAAGPDAPPLPGQVFVLLLGLSLLSTLAVAALFLRRLTRPLRSLAAAAQAAGRGDRAARVAEEGPAEVRALARAFNTMQADIARFDAERMRTLGAVGHDLRTPITSLRIRAEMLDEAEGAPMIRTLDEMTVMADGLLAFARGTAEAEETAPLDLTALLARLAEERGAHLASHDPVTLRARPVALGRLFGNLIDNALRYGGSARIEMSEGVSDVTVTVSDTGPGLDPAALEKMFDPFTRGEGSRNAETGGAGLGLSIARGIARSHGGRIVLSNRPEGGLCAAVTLPKG